MIATRLDGQDLVDLLILETAHQLGRHRAHQNRIHLVIDEAIHFKHATLQANTVAQNTIL